jgi:hypothetical protein
MSKLLLALFVFCCTTAAVAGPEEDAIQHLLRSTFDKPDARLVVEPIVVVGDHAIAGWSQGDLGGRALLRRKGHDWQLVLCSGDQLKSADNLVQMGLPKDVASPLAAGLSDAEKKLPPERLALFAKFDGIVMMDQHGNHPPTPGHHPHGAGHGRH